MTDLLLVIRTYVVLQLLAVAGWPWLAAAMPLRRESGARDGTPEGRSSVGARGARVPPDLAVPLAKSLGLVLVAYLTWLLGFARVPMVAPTIWVIWAVVGASGWIVMRLRPRDIAALFSSHRRAILVGEIVFLVVFLSLCRVRALTPDATFRYDEQRRSYDPSASEKFTNLALLTSLSRERTLPPRDTWFGGRSMNYYYFGHLQWATFGKMAFVPPRVGFNLGQAALFALVAANAFSLALALTRRFGAGVLAAYAVPIMGNPYGFLHLLLAGTQRYQFWDASRIVEGTILEMRPSGPLIAGPITEFPFFTFIVGDFHAHGHSFHTLLLALAIVFLFPMDRAAALGSTEAHRRSLPSLAGVVGMLFLGLLVAVTAMTNTWDAPSLGLLIAAVLVARSLEVRRRPFLGALRGLTLSLLVAGVGFVLLLPHLATFRLPVGAVRDPQAFYIGPLKWLGTRHLSEFKDYMVHFGFALAPLTLLMHARLIGHVRRCEGARRRRWERLLGASYLITLYVFLFAQRFFLLYFLAAMIVYAAALFFAEVSSRRSDPLDAWQQRGAAFIAISPLAAVAFFLSLFAELWVVDDGYAGDWERYNTVFKIYNVCWLVYGVCFAAAVFAFLPWLARRWGEFARLRIAWPWTALAVWLAMGFAYPYAATVARVREHNAPRRPARMALPPGPALDATRYYASVDRDEYDVIEWVRENVKGKPVVAEGCRGESAYTLQSRVATFTGVCTVLAWPQHEANWRSRVRSSAAPDRRVKVWSEMTLRINDLARLYRSSDERVVRAIVERYEIDYILVGGLERALYGGLAAGQRLRTIFPPAIERGDTMLLQTQRAKPREEAPAR